jgi:type VI secretion system secreted protein VgrG
MAALATNGRITQQNRLLGFSTPLGDDVLLVQSLFIQESISALFRINLQLVATDPALPFDQLVGQPVKVRLKLPDGTQRFFHGFLSRLTRGGSDARFTAYAAEVVPWLWFLTRTSDCRVFQHLTVPEIVKKLLGEYGFLDVRGPTTPGRYAKWDYCVQYRETDFNFISRLLEQEGIYYFFEHDDRKHTLVLADAPAAHAACPGQSKAKFLPDVRREAGVTGWQMTREVRPGKCTLRDYHFELPDRPLESVRPGTLPPVGPGRLEVYDYPGEFAKRFNLPKKRLDAVQAEADKLVKLRTEEEEAPHLVVTGSSNCRTFAAGCKFDLVNHPVAAVNDSYVLTAVQHSAVQDLGFVSGGGGGGSYSNSFTCVLLRVPLRPPRLTPKPVVQGPQTAVVVGHQDEEIHVDDYGRVKVQFHWDREGQKNENSSCWVRVAQFWAGKRWGASFWPRVGQEVIVDFLDGDPDQPIVVGSVYNARQMPPYLGDGPDAKHPNDPKVSGVKTCSTPGGNGFNEIRFDDTKGKEQLFLRAENGMDVQVKGGQRTSVGGDDNLSVGGGFRQYVGQSKETEVGADLITHVGGGHVLTVDGYLRMGAQDINCNARVGIYLKGRAQVGISGGDEVCLVSGGSFIKITPGGIWIQAPEVNINSGGSALALPSYEYASPEAAAGADDAKSGFPSNT